MFPINSSSGCSSVKGDIECVLSKLEQATGISRAWSGTRWTFQTLVGQKTRVSSGSVNEAKGFTKAASLANVSTQIAWSLRHPQLGILGPSGGSGSNAWRQTVQNRWCGFRWNPRNDHICKACGTPEISAINQSTNTKPLPSLKIALINFVEVTAWSLKFSKFLPLLRIRPRLPQLVEQRHELSERPIDPASHEIFL